MAQELQFLINYIHVYIYIYISTHYDEHLWFSSDLIIIVSQITTISHLITAIYTIAWLSTHTQCEVAYPVVIAIVVIDSISVFEHPLSPSHCGTSMLPF